MHVVISTTSFGEYDGTPLSLLKTQGYSVGVNPYKRKMKPQELIEFAKDASGIIAGTESLTADVLAKLPALKIISRCGAGLDNVDCVAAKNSGILVFNTPDAPTQAVAELTLGLMLGLARKIPFADRMIRGGGWEKPMGNLVAGKKIGIIGFGRIGRKVAELLKALGCEIAYFDPFLNTAVSGYQRLGKDALLKWADIITIHVSSTDRILDERSLGLMKKGSSLLNLSRGEVIDETALQTALRDGRIAGAALDVFQNEPYAGPLVNLDNVILTPHIGSYAVESRIMMERQAAENLITGLSRNH